MVCPTMGGQYRDILSLVGVLHRGLNTVGIVWRGIRDLFAMFGGLLLGDGLVGSTGIMGWLGGLFASGCSF